MQFVLSPSLLHLYFIFYVSHCINSCSLFLPSADNYFRSLGFVMIACFLLATLSTDDVLQILDRCWGICSGDTVRGIITALFSSSQINKHIPFLASCWVPQCPFFTTNKTHLVLSIFPPIPSHLLCIFLLWPFYIHLALFHLLAITAVAQVPLHSLVPV